MADNSDDEVQVSSVVYNLAGPETGRVDFLKSLLVGAVQREAPLGETISQGYLHGPGMRYRGFANWVRNNPEFISKFGMTSGKLTAIPSVDLGTVKSGIPSADSVEKAELHEARIHYWVLELLYRTRPEETPVPRPVPFTGPSSYSFSSGILTVTWADGTISTVTPSDYLEGARYLYAKYTPVVPAEELPIAWGSILTLAPGDPDPDFPVPPDGSWLLLSDMTAGVFESDLTTQDVVDSSYSDGRSPDHYEYPPLVTPASAPTSYVHYISDVDGGVNSDGGRYSIRTHKEFWREWEVDTRTETVTDTVELDGGVVQTRTITRTTDYLKEVRKVRISTQEVVQKTLLDPRWFIYRYGTGNAVLDESMDAAVAADLNLPQFFYPPIPFRYRNKNIGPLRKIASRWLVNFGVDLGWDDSSYADGFDIQVASGLGGTFTSLNFISHRPDLGPGYYFVEGRDPAWPLYRIFKDSSATTGAGVYKLRSFNESNGTWTDLGDAENLLSIPEPSDYGQDAALAEVYPTLKRAFKKAYDSKFDDVLESVLDNDHIEDVDYAYAVFGVSLNVQENACRKYVYRFLEHLMAEGGAGSTDDWLLLYEAAHASHAAWQTWYEENHLPDGSLYPISHYTDADGHYIEIPAEPERIPYPPIEWKTLTVESVHEGASDYRTQIHWISITRNTGHGILTKSGPGDIPAKPGEFFFKIETNPIAIGEYAPDDYRKLDNRISLNWQVTEDTWEQLVILGLRHENHIYQQYKVTCTAKEAIEWVDGDSPFIVPLHEGVFREMSLVDATQMATACTFLVLNCYQEVEQHWYTSTWFRVVMMVAIIAVSISVALFTGGTSLGAGGAAVAQIVASAGASASVAILAGLASDIAIGLALSYLVTFLSTKFFGEKAGTIVGAVLGLIVGSWVGSGFDLKSVTQIFSSSQGWISLSLALGNGTSQYMQMSARETMAEISRVAEKMSKESARIQKLFAEEFEKNKIDPGTVNQFINEVLEKPDVFLQRTLMTGSDIVEATLGQIDTFVDDRLQLALP